MRYLPISAVVYLVCTGTARKFLLSTQPRFNLRIPKRDERKDSGQASLTVSSARKPSPKTSAGSSTRKNKPGSSKKQTAKPTTKAKKQTSKKGPAKSSAPTKRRSSTNSKSNTKSSKKQQQKQTSQPLPSMPVAREIIELDDSSDSDSDDGAYDAGNKSSGRRASLRRQSRPTSYMEAPDDDGELSYEDDSENEFEG